MLSADAYPSRASNQANSGQDSGGGFDRFMDANVHPAYAKAGEPASESPPRQTVNPATDLHHDPSKVPAGTETLGAMHAPQMTRAYPNAAPGKEGFPAGWTQASNPNATSE
jgi:hypothetical protein